MSEDFRETLYTIDKTGARKWVYPAFQKGFFRSRRTVVISVLMGLYLLMPWIVINGEQAVRIDLLERKLTVLGATLWATDTIYLFILLGSLAFALFFFTAVLGRVWCGWACPQTVFLEFLFRPLETLIEGNASKRRRRDQSPWTLEKVLVKGTKFFVFALVAWVLASTLLAYFVGREELLSMMSRSPTHHLSLFVLTVALMALLLFQFGWFREQFCTVLCPYARFQSVLLDPDSLVVGYDAKRGEPRGKQGGAGHGDCVNCGLCVRVCPTGIDIRNGLQLECVQCASCIDACDSIMTKIGKPTGLIRYATENTLQGKMLRVIRPRVLVYGAILSTYLIVGAVAISNRKDTDFQVIRVVHDSSFTVTADGTVTNHFKVHIGNKATKPQTYSIRVVDADQVKAVVPVDPFPVAAGELGNLPLFVQFPKSLLQRGSATVVLELFSSEHSEGRQKVGLIGPDL